MDRKEGAVLYALNPGDTASLFIQFLVPWFVYLILCFVLWMLSCVQLYCNPRDCTV